MNIVNKITLLSALLIAIIFNGYADDFTATTTSNEIAVGDRFQITYSLNVSGSNFKAPLISDFEILSGPNQSSSMQIINGSFSQTISYSYILKGIKEGSFTILPASIEVDGETLKSNSLSVKVNKGKVKPQAQNQDNQSNKSNINTNDSQLFLKAIVNKSKLYQGEELVVTFKLYSRKDLAGLKDMKLPNYDGFWAKDVELPNKVSLTPEVYQGVKYNTAIFKKTILYPQRSGKLEIPSMELELLVQEKVTKKRRSIFDMFDYYNEVPYTIKSKKIEIEVMPLPEPKPEDFCGIVGNLKLSDHINNTEVSTNDAINFSITLSGSGNLFLINEPEVVFSTDFESYDPKTNDHIKVGSGGISGSRSFEYLLIPRHPGEYVIPSVSFSYFDTNTKKYIQLTSSEYNISVAKGEDYNPVVNTYSGSAKEDVKFIGSDIKFIKTGKVDLLRKGNFFYRSGLFYFLTGLICLMFLLTLGTIKYYSVLNKDVAGKRVREASSVARKHLTKAKKYINQDSANIFYAETGKAIWGFLEDKLQISTAQLNKEVVKDTLIQQKVEETLISDLFVLLENCEMAQYAAISNLQSDKQNVYNKALLLISKLSKQLKK